jgi:hypothetical protein
VVGEFSPQKQRFLVTSAVHKDKNLLAMKSLVGVHYPWNDNGFHFSGIPPNIAILHNIMAVKERQDRLIDEFVARTEELLKRMSVGGSAMMSEVSFRNILSEFQEKFTQQLQSMSMSVASSQQRIGNNPVEDTSKFTLTLYGGTLDFSIRHFSDLVLTLTSFFRVYRNTPPCPRVVALSTLWSAGSLESVVDW